MADSGTPSASTKETVIRRGATRHCCYGLCNSDSRYSDRDYMKDIQWIPFPKPKKNLEKSQRWVRSCGRENFTVDRVTRWTYICSKHFVGGNGPTVDHPDPVPATHTPNQVERFSKKRKAPTPRGKPVTKRLLLEVSEALLSLQNGQQSASAQLPKVPQDAPNYQGFDPQSSRDFAEQGNMYSSYKNYATLKCLVGISPTGGITFLSDVYEGSISDKDIFVRSGLVNLLEPGDLVIADLGFFIKDVPMPHKVDLNIPPFLCGRDRLTAQVEILTKRIARVRIHVERELFKE